MPRFKCLTLTVSRTSVREYSKKSQEPSKAKQQSTKKSQASRFTRGQKAGAVAELKTQMAAFSIEIAEKIVRQELSSDDKQKALADKLVDDINMN